MAKLTPVFLDYETFWSQDHSLTKMSPLAYVMHPETELISVAIKIGNGPTTVVFGEEAVSASVRSIDWSDKLCLAHNNEAFDSLISAWRIGIKPAMWGCTLAMARPHHAKTAGGSLKALSEHYQLGVKDSTALVNTKGRHLKDFTRDEIDAMRVYNAEDTVLCAKLFQKLLPLTSKQEMKLIDMTIRMLVEPKFELDRPLLQRVLAEEQIRKGQMLLELAKQIGVFQPGMEEDDAIEKVRETLASAAKFGGLLTGMGVEVPTKISVTTGKEAPALAKTDEGFLALLESDNPLVAAAAEARLGVKSTLLESRIAAFLEASDVTGGKLPIPTKYYGADTTGRRSGFLFNPLNLPRVSGKPSDCLRNSMKAPEGYKVVVADLAGIELRVNHFLWRVPSSMALYERDPHKADLYKEFASKLYNKPQDEVTKAERQFAKICVAEGTLVLTERGEIPIEQVTADDKVWDGIEYTYTLGAVCNGEQEVITYDGITATPDHEVWVEDGRKVSIEYAAAQSLRLARSGDGGAPLGFGGAGVSSDLPAQRLPIGVDTVLPVPHGETGELRQPKIRENARVPIVQAEVRCSQMAPASDGGGAPTVYQSERQGVPELRRSGDSVQLSNCGASGCMGDEQLGAAPAFGDRPDRYGRTLRGREPSVCVGRDQYSQQAGFPHSAIPHIQGGAPADSVCGQHATESAESGAVLHRDCRPLEHPINETKRRVWDLLNCGPRHRFTANGRLVSNCQLGMGYGAGAGTFRKIAKMMGGVTLDAEGARSAVATWRGEYAEIARGWKTCHAALAAIYQNVEQPIDPWGLCHTCAEGIRTPNGMIRYPKLRQEINDEGKAEWLYGEGRHKARIYAGKVDENVIQSLARQIICGHALEIKRLTGHNPALEVYDELVYIIPESEAAQHLDTVLTVMKTAPSWWPELVLSAEGDIADTYGAAK